MSEKTTTSRRLSLLRAVASGDTRAALGIVAASPELATAPMPIGASRESERNFFLPDVGHYVYEGDTALHIAAAGYRLQIARELVARGGDVRARNRRGAEPLHYASSGGPGSKHWEPLAQAAMIAFLIGCGAQPNGVDKSAVTPLHVAVRTRCAAAVRALLEHGADPRRKNGSGSTPLHLAVQNTGRGGTGAPEARTQQAEIIRALLAHGARLTDRNDRGRSVSASISSSWLEELVHAS